MKRRILHGMAAGLVAGPIVGLLESLYILTTGSPSEYVALLYASLLYAIIGLCVGFLAGIGTACLGIAYRRLSDSAAYSLSFNVVFCSLGAMVSRYLVHQALSLEKDPRLQGDLAILGVFGAIFLVGIWFVPILLTRTPFKILLRLRGTLALYGTLVLLSGVFSFSPAGDGHPEGSMTPRRAQSPDILERPDAILVVVDTLRADHVGAYGASGDPTPALDALARDGILFDQAIVQSTWTRASIASIFTGLVPSSHGVVSKVSVLPDVVLTLAEVLRNSGYITGGVPNNFNVSRTFNFQQGFDWYAWQRPDFVLGATESATLLSMYKVVRKVLERAAGDRKRVEEYYQPAERILGVSNDFIDANGDKAWFLFVHLMEPHDPYFEHPLNGKGYSHFEHSLPDPALLDYLRQTYMGEVHYVDRRLGEFFQDLKDQGRYDTSLIIVTADHGEEFLDHGGWWHGTTLYDEQVRVPLVVKLPHQARAGTRVPWQVRSIDIAPTVAAVAGVPIPPTWEGQDLLGADLDGLLSAVVEGQDSDPPAPYDWASHPGSRLAVSELDFQGNVLSAIRNGGWKYIEANEGNPRGLSVRSLFAVVDDPLELENQACRGRDEEAFLARQLHEQLDLARRAAIQSVESTPDEATQDRLRALGYLQDEPDPDAGPRP